MAASSKTRSRRPVKRKKQSPRRPSRPKTPRTPKLSRTRKPEEMSLEGWQRELRRQFGAEQDFILVNVGEQPIFSDFDVTNPESERTYRVSIRSEELGDNYCSCADFATNTLGTCKHVEFTLARLRRKRGGKKALAEGFQAEYSEVYLQYGAQREVCFRPGSDCSVELARMATRYFDSEGKLRESAFARFGTFLTKSDKIDPDLRVYDDVLQLVAEVRDAQQRETILKKAFPRGIRSAAFKKVLKLSLYDYQREAALFAARAGRTLIADEMGLGKTIEAMAAVEMMAKHFGVERVLIVCPTSLKHQWEREIERATDRTAQVIGGLKPKRAELFANDSFYKITNYDTVFRDLEAIERWSPDLVILDEAQRIKNWKTRTARSVKLIDSPYCIVLTGTPLENRLEELVSIVQFIDRHRLGPTFRFLHDHQEFEEGTTRVVGYRNLDRIGETLKPILIRRRKDEVLDQLPERIDKNFFVPMTPQQMDHHEENREIVAQIIAKWRRFGFLSEADQRRLMICLQNMRMSCNSTFLLDKKTDFGTKADEWATLLEEVFEQPGVKAVVFSQWVRTHELLQRRIAERKWDHIFFHGGVPSPKRKGLVDRFREDPNCRLFLSTDAGGVGLNLQNASVVVNMDLPWNPAILEQRIGRVHRLGQKRPVQVFNFVAEGTIEHGMLSLLGFKQSLFAGVLDGGEKNVFLGGSRLKLFMESVETATADCERTTQPAEPEVNGSPTAEDRPPAEPPIDSPSPAPAATDPLAGLLQNGLALLEQFAGASSGTGSQRDPTTARSSAIEIVRDDPNKPPYLKLPMPDPELLSRVLFAVQQLVGGSR